MFLFFLLFYLTPPLKITVFLQKPLNRILNVKSCESRVMIYVETLSKSALSNDYIMEVMNFEHIFPLGEVISNVYINCLHQASKLYKLGLSFDELFKDFVP